MFLEKQRFGNSEALHTHETLGLTSFALGFLRNSVDVKRLFANFTKEETSLLCQNCWALFNCMHCELTISQVSHSTDKKTKAQRQRELPKVTQLLSPGLGAPSPVLRQPHPGLEYHLSCFGDNGFSDTGKPHKNWFSLKDGDG